MTLEPAAAHPPPQALADRVLDATRRRRWALAVATVVLGLVGAVVGVVAVAAAGERPAPPTAAARALGATNPSRSVDVYAAAVAAQTGVVHIADALPAAGRRALTRRFGNRVRFDDALPPASGRSTVVVLRGLRVHGGTADLNRDRLCGALCGRGDELHLARRGGSWQLVGVRGPDWLNWTGGAVSRPRAS